jgi:transcriptional regulator with XRE-family HTH domain
MNVSLANKLSSMRTAAGLSEAEAAALADLTPEMIKAWEHGEGSPSLAESVTLSQIYGTDISQFAEGVDFSNGVSLKKSVSVPFTPQKTESAPSENQHGIKFTPYSEGYLREKIPDKYTDNEIYPQRQTAYNEAPNAYSGAQSGYGGTQSGYNPQSGYGGTQSGYGGTQSGYSGTQSGYGGTQNVYDTAPKAAYSGAQDGFVNAPRTAYAEPPKSSGGINIEVVENRIREATSYIPPDVADKAGKFLRKTGEIIDSAAEGVRRAINNVESPETPKSPEIPYEMPRTSADTRREIKYMKEQEAYQKAESKAEKKRRKKQYWKKSSLLYKTFPLLMTALFFFGIAIGLESISWMSFLLIPLYYGFHNARMEHDMKKFPYPVLALILFLFPLIVFGDDNVPWALGILFTIPFYYILIDHIRGKRE